MTDRMEAAHRMQLNSTLHSAMDQLVGTWRTEGVIVDGSEHHGVTWHGHDVYEWFPGMRHMVHRVDVEIFGERKEAIELFTPRDSSPAAFDQTSFDADGTVEHAVGSFDREGRYHNDLEDARAIVSFDGPDSMRALWEKRLPTGAWSTWMDVVFTRIGPPHIEIRSITNHAG
jgi:hypothetical protein